MTISDQLREAALYEKSPAWAMSNDAFGEALLWRDGYCHPLGTVQGRTFLLLVAEALE